MKWSAKAVNGYQGELDVHEHGDGVAVLTNCWGILLDTESARELRDTLTAFIEGKRKHEKKEPRP